MSSSAPFSPVRRTLLAAASLAPWAARAQAAPQPRPWPAARPAPPLELPTWDGPPFRLAEARGQVVLVNFWASWCEPCRSEMPSLELLAERHAKDGVTVVCVNHRETDGAIGRYLAQWPISLPILRDRDGAAAQAWGVRVYPTTIAVGRQGRPVFTITGEVDWGGADARRWVAALL